MYYLFTEPEHSLFLAMEEMHIPWVAGYKIFGCQELEERCAEWRRMASNSKEGQGPQRAVVPVMMMMMMMMMMIAPLSHTSSQSGA
jgi:hypothetical protein